MNEKKRGFSNLSKLPEDQFPPSFPPPTSLLRKGPSLFFNRFVLPVYQFFNQPTDRRSCSLVSLSLILLVSFPDFPTDRPTVSFVTIVTFSQTFNSFLYEFHLLRQSDRPTDRPSDRRSVGGVESAVRGSPV